MHYALVGLMLICVIKERCLCLPVDSSVISKYAKVAVWRGQNATARKIGNFWNHRLDDPTTKATVAYQYPVYQHKTEHVPGIGEVIVAQDRFEARPLFAYKNKISPTYLPPSGPKPTAAPPTTAADLYKSPYSSYNPPEFKPSDSQDNSYPPNVVKDDAPPQSDPYASLGPPLAQQPQENSPAPGYDDNSDYTPPKDVVEDPMAMYKDPPSKHDDDYSYHPMEEEPKDHDPPKNNDQYDMHGSMEGPPEHPPKNEEDIYYPPDFPQDQIQHDDQDMMDENHHMMGGDHDDHQMMDDDDDHHMMDDDHHDPPPPPPPEDPHMVEMPKPDHPQTFPKYLYDQHYYDHHLYEEIPHTTMPPAKEDKRVSSTHYSYYYLGRKLWYIPLYFSIYFIIYVTVLIVKSIVRHKVKLKYKWYDHHDSGRSLDLEAIKLEELNQLQHNVTNGLIKGEQRYGEMRAMK